MATGVYNIQKLLIHRPEGSDRRTKPEVKVFKAGPFLEVYLNDILAGKAMKLSDAYCTDSMGDCSGRCIRLPNVTLILTDEEATTVMWEMNVDAERRSEKAEQTAQAQAELAAQDIF